MATSYTDGIAIELIGSGDQAGTWGDTTNDNLQRIEQGIAQYAEVELSDPSPTSWTLLDTVAAYASGSEGRAAYVKFTGSLSGTHTVNIRGHDGSTQARRVFFAHNGTNRTLTFTAGSGASVNLSSGFIALIYTTSVASDSDVVNGLANLSVDKVELANGETIENGTNNQIDLKAVTTTVGGGSAGTLSTTSTSDLTLNTNTGTDTGSIVIADGVNGNITLTTNGTGDIALTTGSTSAGVLLIDDGYLNFKTTTGSGGYGLRDSSGIIQASNESGVWRNVITGTRTAVESGQFHIKVFPVLDADTQSATDPHNLVNTPSLVTCSLRCISIDLGYAAGDEVYWSWSGAYNSNDGLSIYANATNVGYILGSGDSMKIPRLDGTTGDVDVITLGKWSVVIRAWK